MRWDPARGTLFYCTREITENHHVITIQLQNIVFGLVRRSNYVTIEENWEPNKKNGSYQRKKRKHDPPIEREILRTRGITLQRMCCLNTVLNRGKHSHSYHWRLNGTYRERVRERFRSFELFDSFLISVNDNVRRLQREKSSATSRKWIGHWEIETDQFDTLVVPNVRLLFTFDFEKFIRSIERRIVRVLSVER